MARYELIERIGVGGMAEIFRGKAVAGGGFEKPVAIKRILPHLSQDRRFVELLIAEAKTLSQLRHRNIVQIYDVGLGDDGQYFLVMEYVEGVDLQLVYEGLEKRRDKVPLPVALHIGAEVCEALDHAHRVCDEDGQPIGLVHRDVSPSNVLLSRSGEVKLTDFGIAKRMEEATGHGGVRGKFAYISPEQAANVHVDGRSDVYSLGIVMFELLTGRRLFSALPDFDALRAVREGNVPAPSTLEVSIPDELEQILMTSLAADPEDRFPTAGHLASQLRGFRYSLDSTLGDPSKEVAGLVSGFEREPEDEPELFMEPERTVVRINTAAGFPGGGVDEDAETRAEPMPDSAYERAGGPPVPSVDEEAETRAFDISLLQTLNPPRTASTPDPEEEETRLLERPAKLKELEMQAGQAGHQQAPPVERLSEAGGPHLGHERAATPTVRDVFYGGELTSDSPSSEQSAAAASQHAAAISAARRRILRRNMWIVGGLAVALGLAAFAIAGAILRENPSGGEAAGEAVPPDAGPVDAAMAGEIEMPPDELEPAKTREARRRERAKRAARQKRRRAAERRKKRRLEQKKREERRRRRQNAD